MKEREKNSIHLGPDSKKRRRRRVFSGLGPFHVHHTGCVSTHLQGPHAAALALSAVRTVAAGFLFSALETQHTLSCAASPLTQSTPATSVPRAAAAGSDTTRQSPIASLRPSRGIPLQTAPLLLLISPFRVSQYQALLAAAAAAKREKRKVNP